MDEPPHGTPRLDWDPGHDPFDETRVDPIADTLRCDRTAPYGRAPGGAAYSERDYAERFHKLGPKGEHAVAWPPNQGAVMRTKVDYTDDIQFVHEFGQMMDRFGPPSGAFMALIYEGPEGNRIPASYEARAIHYDSLYGKPLTYTLVPGNLPLGWKIRVMDTAPALGQPGRWVSLVFLTEIDEELSIDELIDAEVLQ
ncbi:MULTISPECIES: glycohydrolase toxin TNT-related protein [unclassified Mycobacterium]|uniref:glycohydrolase toxin TNT-related protein n=1 Tax=unclassified Mycobacterium TaxID=2642494 RepID=UPI0006DC72E4|nr:MULTISPECIES: glycohydrolase toxin TNT-related protein [unclassified Mycobacterium]